MPKIKKTGETTIKKGMILAAGLGTRLLPITNKTPKPLVPVLNVANLLYGVFLLKRTGIEEIALNLHHLPDTIVDFLGTGEKWGVKFYFSRESHLLGTGGGLKKAEAFFEKQPLVLINCDFISNVDLKPLIRRHQELKALASMVLWDDPQMQAFYGKVGISAKGHLCSLPLFTSEEPVRTGIFTGIHILEPEIFGLLEESPSGINQVLYPALMKDQPDRTFGLFMDKEYWYDTGALPQLYQTTQYLLESLNVGYGPMREFMKTMGKYEEKTKGVWAPIDVALPQGVTFEPPVILGRDCKFGQGARIGPYAVIGDQSIVGEEAKISRVIALQGAKIPAHQASEKVIQYEELAIRIP